MIVPTWTSQAGTCAHGRECDQSPAILDALEEDLEVTAVSALRKDEEEGLDEIGVTQVD